VFLRKLQYSQSRRGQTDHGTSSRMCFWDLVSDGLGAMLYTYKLSRGLSPVHAVMCLFLGKIN